MFDGTCLARGVGSQGVPSSVAFEHICDLKLRNSWDRQAAPCGAPGLVRMIATIAPELPAELRSLENVGWGPLGWTVAVVQGVHMRSLEALHNDSDLVATQVRTQGALPSCLCSLPRPLSGLGRVMGVERVTGEAADAGRGRACVMRCNAMERDGRMRCDVM